MQVLHTFGRYYKKLKNNNLGTYWNYDQKAKHKSLSRIFFSWDDTKQILHAFGRNYTKLRELDKSSTMSWNLYLYKTLQDVPKAVTYFARKKSTDTDRHRCL